MNASYCEECGDKQRSNSRRFYRKKTRSQNKEIKALALEVQGGTSCECCGEQRLECLTLDHIAQDGARRRREGDRAGLFLYAQILENGRRTDLRVLCQNCNISAYRHGGTPRPREP